MKKGSACLVLILVAIVTVIVGSITEGYVISMLWEWFIVPIGVSSISFLQGAGISLIFSLFLMGLAKSESSDSVSSLLAVTISHVFIYPAIILFLGYVLHSFM